MLRRTKVGRKLIGNVRSRLQKGEYLNSEEVYIQMLEIFQILVDVAITDIKLLHIYVSLEIFEDLFASCRKLVLRN